jgi:cytoskeletal protein RodZ
MTSLEDQLHELFSSARTPVDGATGDIDRVRSEVRRRQLRRRTAGVIMTAAVIVLAAGVILASARDGNAVRTGPVTEPTTPTTDSPRSTTNGPSSTTSSTRSTTSTSTSTPTSSVTTATTAAPSVGSLEPPDADLPAAGICAGTDTSVVEVVLNADVPSPRCTEVTADQRLVVRNATTDVVTVTLADFRVTVAPGESELLDRPFGEYLAPGVHRVSTGALYGGSGPEIWLKP